MAQQLATQSEDRKDVALVSFLNEKVGDFKTIGTIDPEKFMKSVSHAILKDPKIAEASKRSVYLEVSKACADGLVLDGREATLTRFKTKKDNQWVTEVVYIPMVAGIMKRVRNSGEILAWSVELVYQKEYETGRFKYTAAPIASIEHEPIIFGDRGPVIAAYSAVRLKDGSMHYEVMTKDQLDGIRARTKSKTNEGKIVGPWASDTDEMYRKTVIRRHAKRLPVSSELITVTQRVDSLYPDNSQETEEATIVSETARPKTTAAQRIKELQEEEEKAPAKKSSPRAKKPVEKPSEEDDRVVDADIIEHDPVTGEISDDGDPGPSESDINEERDF